MQTEMVYHPAATREFKDFGFMQAHLSFKPHLAEGRRRFGPLITIDNGTLAPGAQGFGMHPHRDVEVVTFMVSGEVSHIDPVVPVHNGTVKAKGLQVITAGTGILHNEVNNSRTKPMRALQIWFEPRARDLAPAYSSKELEAADHSNRFQLVLSPDGAEGSLVVQQEVRLSYGSFDRRSVLNFSPSSPDRSLYIFMIEGEATAAGVPLGKGDGLGLLHAGDVAVEAAAGAELLIFELPASEIS
ncbi:pirin family protein [Leisingera aquaemixtae]|uniref:pirin family protein n=1 Tax=Leisingera aquaemixtae TaxID=1396826 RepID=UPI001C963369|nr:pirin family protein [Leisingera aquaemixtae]MBY6068957.1 pirin family protein [Leisingera aquaemixtae]